MYTSLRRDYNIEKKLEIVHVVLHLNPNQHTRKTHVRIFILSPRTLCPRLEHAERGVLRIRRRRSIGYLVANLIISTAGKEGYS